MPLVEQARAGAAIPREALRGLRPDCLVLGRNAVFARHGRPFESDALRSFFTGQSWYTPDDGYSDERLEPVDRENIALMIAVEQDRKLAALDAAKSWRPLRVARQDPRELLDGARRLVTKDGVARRGAALFRNVEEDDALRKRRAPFVFDHASPFGPLVLACDAPSGDWVRRAFAVCEPRAADLGARDPIPVTKLCPNGSRIEGRITAVVVFLEGAEDVGLGLMDLEYFVEPLVPGTDAGAVSNCVAVRGHFGNREPLPASELVLPKATREALQAACAETSDAYGKNSCKYSPADYDRDGRLEVIVTHVVTTGDIAAFEDDGSGSVLLQRWTGPNYEDILRLD